MLGVQSVRLTLIDRVFADILTMITPRDGPAEFYARLVIWRWGIWLTIRSLRLPHSVT